LLAAITVIALTDASNTTRCYHLATKLKGGRCGFVSPPDLVAVVGDADPARDDMRGLEQPAVAGSAVGEIGTDLRSGRHREKRRSDRPDAGEGRRGEPALGATILEAQRPALHRVRTFKLSNEPKFAEKLKDVVGLYVDPPAHAVVLSV